MVSFMQEVLTLNTNYTVLRVSPKEHTFLISFALSFYEKAVNFPHDPLVHTSLQRFYAFFPALKELLANSNLLDYYSYFETFCNNIKSYQSVIQELTLNSNGYFVHSAFYMFSGLLSLIFGQKSLVFYAIDLREHTELVNTICGYLEVSLKICRGEEIIHECGKGLEIRLFSYSSSEFAVFLGQTQAFEQKTEEGLINSLFACIAVPKLAQERQILVDWVKKYYNVYGNITGKMQEFLDVANQWQCGHDMKEIKTNCNSSHCVYCLYENIKNDTPETAKCLCGMEISAKDFETIFKKAQPKYNRHYLCCMCNNKFQINSSLECAKHAVCLMCRSENINACVICQRLYSENEKNQLKVNADYKEIACLSCKRVVSVKNFKCNNQCPVCEDCWINLRACKGCGENTNSQNSAIIICVVCNSQVNSSNLAVKMCKHPFHQQCAGNRNECKKCSEERKAKNAEAIKSILG
jgi:hypothetical protein